jgi:AcrR family transcriptional regulator
MTGGLVERNKVRTRRELAEAAARLFLTRGYSATTVQDIAAAADVSPRTFFRYFPSKDEIVTAIASTGMDDVVEALAEVEDTVPLRAALHVALSASVAKVRDDPDAARAFQILLRETPALRGRWLEEQRRNRDRLAEALRPWFPGSSDPLAAPLAAGVALLAVEEAVAAWTDDPSIGDPVTLLDHALDILDGPLLSTGAP